MYMLTLLLGICSAFSFSSSQNIVGCYYNSGAIFRNAPGSFGIKDIDPSLCTHVMYPHPGPLNNGDISLNDDRDLERVGNGYRRFDVFRKANPSVKTILSVSRWSEPGMNYSATLANSLPRVLLIQKIINTVEKYNFDGFDVNWQYPPKEDKDGFRRFLTEMGIIFSFEKKILCITVGAKEETVNTLYNIRAVNSAATIIHLVAYQFHSSYDKGTNLVGANSPLYAAQQESAVDKTLNVDFAVNQWLQNGANPRKLLLGIDLSGISYSLSTPIGRYGRGIPSTGPGEAGKYTKRMGTLGYNEICELIKNNQWNGGFDPEQQVPYAFKGAQLASFENVQSIKGKSEYIKTKQLAGAMINNIDTDDFRGGCGEKFPLLKTVNRIVRNLNI